MLGTTYETQVCSIARSLEFVGERWTLLILRNALFANSTRFGEFQRGLGIATNVLASRLDGLVSAGIMTRTESDGATNYVLTDKGRDFAPALIALTHWGDRWAAPQGAPIEYRHAACGSAVAVRAECERCGDIDASSIDAHAGPGMPEDRAEVIEARILDARAVAR
jgi:DNA-binding HxlR family transcriptional regulator